MGKLKIITGIKELEKNIVAVEEVRIKYAQKQDDFQTDGMDQHLTLETHDSGAGMYYAMSTKRWAFDDPDELTQVINDFIERIKSKDDE